MVSKMVVGFALIANTFITNSLHLQLMVDTVILKIGQNVLLNVEEELRQGLEPARTLLQHTEELTV